MQSYISTRGKAPRLNFSDATLTGLAVDGGLYVPDGFPALPKDSLDSLPYFEVAERVMTPFVGKDFSAPELVQMLADSYVGFDHPDIAPLHRLDDRFYVLELFHGPTLAFKDIALQFLGHIFDAILARRKKRITIVAATSGDTGSAAIEAFQDKDNADIFVLHPHGRVSEVQRRQMTTVQAGNVFNIAIEGSFDDCQNLVKAMFNDTKFRYRMELSAVNSINWARILAQIVYYVAASHRVHKTTGKAAAFCVPTGNFGNIYAGYVAKMMGAPIDKLIAATNRNDILHRFFTTGVMQAEAVQPSLSPSMDIQISSNFERLLFDGTGHDDDAVRRMLQEFQDKGSFAPGEGVMAMIGNIFASGRHDDEQTLATMKSVHQDKNYLIDPHTAVGIGVAKAYQEKNKESVMVSLATAHPAKFPDAVQKATGITPPLPDRLADLYKRPEKYKILPASLAKVKDFMLENGRQQG